jgi:HK97 family phage major capsid protein
MSEAIMKALDSVEMKLKSMSEKADGELATLGKVTADTKAAIDAIGVEQRVLADRMLQLEQKGAARGPDEKTEESWGLQFTKSEQFKAFASGNLQKARVEVKNTVTNTVGNTFSDRKPAIVGGAFRTLTLEELFVSLPTSSNAVDYVRENVFTNSAAETAEGAAKPESAVTTTPITEPVATVAHWIKISRQLAADNAALAAYINLRMRYGVDLRVENQIINGNGTAPNMSGMLKTGNFTAHGYTAASLTTRFGAGYTRLDLLRAVIADCMTSDYPCDAIILNPVDWATIETLKDSQGRYIIGNPNDGSAPRVWKKPIVESNAIGADQFIAASLMNAATFYNREGVVVEVSESDSDNFTKNLVTVRAERRCMLAVERPAAIRAGDLTPA